MPRAYAALVDAERASELLSAERTRIERELRRLGPLDDGEVSADGSETADLGTDTYQAEYDEGRADNLREQLAAVERAERRLADGSYGVSVASGEPIPDDRLEAFPTAELTADEERARER
jgi:DnaK suppressor protein